MLSQNLFSGFFRQKNRFVKKASAINFESLEPRIAMAAGLRSASILHSIQLSNGQQQDANKDRAVYLKKQQELQRILTDGQWLSTHRDINVYHDGKVTSIKKTDGNNYTFSLASPTQLKAVNSYLLSDDDPTVHTVHWIVQVNPVKDSFILRDPTTPTREATGRYDRKTDTLVLSINGPAGPGAEPSQGPAWGITTNYYTHVRNHGHAGPNSSTEPILKMNQMSKCEQQDANKDRTAYLKKQQELQRILTDGQWLSTHRDINVFNGGNATNISKSDGNNYTFSLASPTQLSAVNSYLLADGDPTLHKVNWIVQANPFENTFILRDPTTPAREAKGYYNRKTDTLVLLINGPAGPSAEPSQGPAWGITTNYFTHVSSRSLAGASADPVLKIDQLSRQQQQDAYKDKSGYLKKQQELQQILTNGEWMSTHRDINVYNGDKVTCIKKTDGNNYTFSLASPTQLNAVNSYLLADGDSTVHKVNWIVQINPFKDSFILRDPTMPSREAIGRFDRKTDTLVLMINGPAGPGAEPAQGPAWGITTNYYTHVKK